MVFFSPFSVYALEKDSSSSLKNTFKNLYKYAPASQEVVFDQFLDYLDNEQGKSELEYSKIFVHDKSKRFSFFSRSVNPIYSTEKNLKKNQNSFFGFKLESSFFLKAFLVFLFSFIFTLLRKKKLKKEFR